MSSDVVGGVDEAETFITSVQHVQAKNMLCEERREVSRSILASVDECHYKSISLLACV